LRGCREAALSDLARPRVRGARGAHRHGDGDTLYRATLDTTVDAIAVIDQHQIVRIFNRAAERLFGYAAEAVIGRPIGMLLPDPIRATEDLDLDLGLDPGRRAAGGIWREATGRRADGAIIALDLSAAQWIEGTRPYLTATMRAGAGRARAKSESDFAL
jgi:PAS domain S-box-containing protein